ncbi:MAG: DUF692 domain-containing protein [Pseudomonadota bacterium]
MSLPLNSPLLAAVPCCGMGLRQPHYADVMEQRPSLGFVEVHSENFFGDGGAALAVLEEVRSVYPVSLHGVGLSLGSAVGLDPWHLDRLAALVERIDPVRVSDHASFARAPGRAGGGAPVHAHDLLPIAFTTASLDIMVRHVSQVQDRLRRPLLVENLSAYLAWSDDSLAEPDFLNELARRSGCQLLVDVNNLVVNALNARQAPVPTACAWLDRLHPGHVAEIHLAGYNDLGDIVIDDHGSRVHEPVWAVYRHAVQRWGRVPALLEWDTDVPALSVLLDEVQRAEQVLLAHDKVAA